MNRNDIYERAAAAYRRRCTFPTIYQQPSSTASGFETINDREVFVLRNGFSVLAAFQILPTGRIGKPVAADHLNAISNQPEREEKEVTK